MKTKILRVIIISALFIFSNGAQSQVGNIDSLRIVPAYPTTSSVIKAICYSTFSSAGCSLNNSTVSVSGNTVTIQAYHTIGMLTMICHSVDTITIGALPAGVYLLNYSIHNNSNSNLLDNANLNFTVQATTNINQQSGTNTVISVYPNPAMDYITINNLSINNEPAQITFYTVIGKIAEQYSTTQSALSINTQNLVPGVYLLHISKAGSVPYLKTIVINNR